MCKVLLPAMVLVSAWIVHANPESLETGEPDSTVEARPPRDVGPVDHEEAAGIRMRYSREIREAGSLYRWGLLLTFGGLGVTLLSSEMSSAFGTLGGIAYLAGEPMMGIAAGRLNLYAREVPGHADPGSGWKYYWSAWGFKGAGAVWLAYVLLSNIEAAGAGPVIFPYVDVTWEDVALPLLTIATGYVCEGVALYKFHARQRAARATLAASLSWSPTLRRDSEGGLQPGLSLALAFE